MENLINKKLKLQCINTLGVLLAILTCLSCNKEDAFLDKKPIQSLTVPTTLKDFQAVLNNENVFNAHAPNLGIISGDDFSVTTSTYINSLYTETERNAYLWKPDIYNGEQGSDWNNLYKEVYYSNVVLEGIQGINTASAEQQQYNQIKGSALFYRSISFYYLLQLFSAPFDSLKTTTDLGVPLRLNSDLNIKSTRAPQKQCYDQILSDLQIAAGLLPSTATYKTQPTKAAAQGLLARVYLSMGDYKNAYDAANSCLNAYGVLTDFNTLVPTTYSISKDYVPEIIFHEAAQGGDTFNRTNNIIDSALYRSYDDDDLRKSKYYPFINGEYRFVGTFNINIQQFTGLATDEIYLIRAECSARLGNTTQAMNDLNALLTTRWEKGSDGKSTYINKTASSAQEALIIILTERRKELVFRGIRWTDLRRLNKDPRFAITLHRNIDGITYTLPPNDKRYVFPIPENEIKLSGIQQNER